MKGCNGQLCMYVWPTIKGVFVTIITVLLSAKDGLDENESSRSLRKRTENRTKPSGASQWSLNLHTYMMEFNSYNAITDIH